MQVIGFDYLVVEKIELNSNKHVKHKLIKPSGAEDQDCGYSSTVETLICCVDFNHNLLYVCKIRSDSIKKTLSSVLVLFV